LDATVATRRVDGLLTGARGVVFNQ
jgi:hypothetical protein